MCYIDLATGKAPRNKSLHWPLLAEAASKRRITKAGGNSHQLLCLSVIDMGNQNLI